MNILKRIGIDAYMLLLIGMVMLGILLPAKGLGADIMGYVTYFAVSLLFFLYGAKLNASAIVKGLLNWKPQLLTFAATFLLFPVLGLGLAAILDGHLVPNLILGLLFLSVLPSTVQSSIAFTAIAGGNVPAAICAASLSNLIGVVLTPILVVIVLHQDGGGVGFAAIIKIGTQILLPFLLGQLLRPWIGAFIQRHKVLSIVVDRGSILLIVYSAFSAGTVANIWSVIPVETLVLLFCVIAVYLAIAMGLMKAAGKALRLPREDRSVLFFCGSTKSIASGIPIATAIFAPEIVSGVILPAMMYHITQLLVCAVISRRMADTVVEPELSR
ncbi:bile acid:sodium symporter [Tianweitania sp. BSSL-BM11]|uniref:Bile acid:sodium symporter n=1 Tax=Tianweitania aestuarii TaxID=2814886 RepID=A0ABS5S012_9HYPH|nr:bile acid:sodium symporter family protein [Tianweitania aestuarii]MBS9722635.1 bile acid:sodium symporter [Tianweitania aestuarii]